MDIPSKVDLADNLVDEWHGAALESGNSSLWQHMRLTHDEYKLFVEQGTLPADFYSRHPELFAKKAFELLERLVYDDDCDYDHNRNCQSHLFFNLQGEDCPNAQAQRLLGLLRHD